METSKIEFSNLQKLLFDLNALSKVSKQYKKLIQIVTVDRQLTTEKTFLLKEVYKAQYNDIP